MPDSEKDSLRNSVLVEEYRSLRNQIDYQVKETRDLERYSLVGVGLIYAWLASIKEPSPLIFPAWFFPPLLAILGMLRAKSMMRRLDQIADYIRQIENEVYPGPLKGWETCLRDARSNRKSPRLGKSHRIYWYTLVGFTILSSAYGFIFHVFKR